jgi:hypothetical protein
VTRTRSQTISLVGKIIVIWSSNGQNFILPQQKEDIIDMASKYCLAMYH